MPDGYMLDVWVIFSNILDCMLQSMWEAFLICFEIGPASVELMFAMGVLVCLVKVKNNIHLTPKPTRDCQLSSMIKFVTETYKLERKID